jgi:hypothetical protein
MALRLNRYEPAPPPAYWAVQECMSKCVQALLALVCGVALLLIAAGAVVGGLAIWLPLALVRDLVVAVVRLFGGRHV